MSEARSILEYPCMTITCREGDSVRVSRNGRTVYIFAPAKVIVKPKCPISVKEMWYRKKDDAPVTKRRQLKSETAYDVINHQVVILEMNQFKKSDNPLLSVFSLSGPRTLGAIVSLGPITATPAKQGDTSSSSSASTTPASSDGSAPSGTLIPSPQGGAGGGATGAGSRSYDTGSGGAIHVGDVPEPTDWCLPTIEAMPILKNVMDFKWNVWVPPAAPVFARINKVMSDISSGTYKLKFMENTVNVMSTGMSALTVTLPTIPKFPAFPDILLASKITIDSKLIYYDANNINQGYGVASGGGYKYPVYSKTLTGEYKMNTVDVPVPNPKYKTTSAEPATITSRMPILFAVFGELKAVKSMQTIVESFVNQVNSLYGKSDMWDFTWTEVQHQINGKYPTYGGKDPDFFKALQASVDKMKMYPNDMVKNPQDFAENAKRIAEFVNASSDVTAKMGANVMHFFEKSLNNFKDSGTAFIQMANELPPQVLSMIQRFGIVLVDSVNAYMDVMKNYTNDLGKYGEQIASDLQSTANELKQKVETFITKLVDALKLDMQAIQGFFSGIITDLTTAVSQDMAEIPGYIKNVSDSLNKNVTANASELGTSIQADIQLTMNWMRQQTGKLGSCMQNNIMFAQKLARQALEAIQAEFNKALATVKADLKLIVDEVNEQVANVKKSVADIENIAKKLADDIVNQGKLLEVNKEELAKLKSDYEEFRKATEKRIDDLQVMIKSGGTSDKKSWWPFGAQRTLGMCIIEYN